MFKLFGNKRKCKLPDEVRVQYSASSFSFTEDDVFSCSCADDAKDVMKEKQGYAVILIPGLDLLSEPKTWVRVLSMASFVLVLGNKDEKYLKRFLSLLDAQVFSPLPKALSGSICVNDQEEARDIIQALPYSEKCITIISE